jgi:hypothetical protein
MEGRRWCFVSGLRLRRDEEKRKINTRESSLLG